VAGSESLSNLVTGLVAVDNVLSFAKTKPGKPSAKERSLFVASVALSYAVWENFAEDVIVEAVTFMAEHVDAEHVPEPAKDFIAKNTSAWELAVHPGWRQLWVDRLTLRAKGDPDRDDGEFGLLTADVRGVQRLAENAGLDLLGGLTKPKRDKLDELVRLRGGIVHTGQAPDDFYKANAVDARALVNDIATQVDAAVRAQVESMVGSPPWK
jgi:hypothetical protein